MALPSFVLKRARTCGALTPPQALATLAAVLLACVLIIAGGMGTAKAYADSDTSDSSPLFRMSTSELNLVAQTDTLRVGMFPDRAPMNYVNASGEPVGVERDILDLIAQETGLSFEYVVLEAGVDLGQQIEQRDLDMISGVEELVNKGLSISLTFTNPYCSTRGAVVFSDEYTYATLARDLPFAVTLERAAAYEANGYHIQAYPTIRDCLNAVNTGRAVYTYENAYIIEELLRDGAFEHVQKVDATVQVVESRFGLVEDNPELINLLNRAIDDMSVSSIISLVYTHTYTDRTVTVEQFIAQHPLIFTLMIAVPFVILASALGVVAFTRSRAANRDPLTQLLNAAAFQRKVGKRAKSAASDGVFACMVVVDIDNFKQVNDTYGHLEGDRALKATAQALAELSRKRSDSCARMGGDEFLAYWEETSEEALQRRGALLVRTITDNIASQTAVDNNTAASVGIACWRANESYEAWYRRADKALYQAKENGKGQVSVCR